MGAESTGDVVQWFSILTALLFLSAASVSDWRSREVSDKIWWSFAPIGGFLTAYGLLLSPEHLVATAVSVTATTIIALLLYYVGVYGGADAKALICLGITLPLVPQNAVSLIGHVHPIFPLIVLYNSYLLAFFSSIALIAYNFYQYVERKGSLFPALEHESPTRKFLAMLTGYRVEFGKLESSIHLYPMEEPAQSESKERKLRLLVSADADREELVRRLKTSMQAQDGKVWATPGLPLLIFVTAGFLLVVFVGDLLMWLVFSFFNSL